MAANVWGTLQMRSIKLLTETAGPPLGIADRWYVSDGATLVGPVGLELIARGVEAGKVPLESYVRHEAWKVWRPLSELAEVSVDSAAPTPPYHPRPAATRRDMWAPHPSYDESDDITLPGRPVFPEEVMPQDALAGAADVDDALLLLFNAAVLRSGADAALLHVVRPWGYGVHDTMADTLADDTNDAVILHAHGPFSRNLVGERTSLLDPALAAAAGGNLVMAEPSPGEAGRAIRDRMLDLGIACEAACLMPAVASGRLVAALELGRKGQGFRASELYAVEGLVEALVHRIEREMW